MKPTPAPPFLVNNERGRLCEKFFGRIRWRRYPNGGGDLLPNVVFKD